MQRAYSVPPDANSRVATGVPSRAGDDRPTPMRVLNAAQMREADRRTIEDIGIPSLVLMENAGRQVVAAMEAMHSDLLERQVAVLCGRGNNGGDGFVVARTLLQRGVDVVGVPDRPRRRRARRRAHQPRDPRPPRPDRRRDRRQPGVGAALLRGQRLHADRRRDLRHRPERAGHRPDRDRSSPTSTRRASRSSSIDLPSGLSADSRRADRRLDRGGHDGHARARRSCRWCCRRPRRAPATSSSPTSAFRPTCSTRSTARASSC